MPTIPEAIREVVRFVTRQSNPLQVGELVILNDELNKKLETLQTEKEKAESDLDYYKGELLDATSLLTEVAGAIDRDIPSFREQTPWPCGLYDLGKVKQKGVRFFNCAYMDFKGEHWLVTRRAISSKEYPNGMNDIVAFKLVDNKPQFMQPIQFQSRYRNEHFEDPRVSVMGGQNHISVTTFHQVGRGWTYGHQLIGALKPDWKVKELIDPVYGSNGGSTRTNSGYEKNWLWFEHEGSRYCVYGNTPHIVIEWNGQYPKKVYQTEDHNPHWKHGHIRGGTAPVLIGQEYFSFFHSSLPWLGTKRRYHMGCYAFEAKPPFRIKRSTSLPLLSASRNDPFHEGLPLVIFPCGAKFKDGKWMVAFGVNDCECGWIEIPHEDLMQRMKPV